MQYTFCINWVIYEKLFIYLLKLDVTPGYPVLLLQISSSNDVDVSLRQAAAIHVKQLIKNKWSSDDPTKLLISEADKKLLKANIVEVLIYSPPRVRFFGSFTIFHSGFRSQVCVALSTIVEEDFPANWPELIPKIMTYLSNQDVNILAGALEALRVTIKKFEYVTVKPFVFIVYKIHNTRQRS